MPGTGPPHTVAEHVPAVDMHVNIKFMIEKPVTPINTYTCSLCNDVHNREPLMKQVHELCFVVSVGIFTDDKDRLQSW